MKSLSTFEKLFKLIAPKLDKGVIDKMAKEMEVASDKSADEFEKAFLDELITYHVAQLFDNKVSLEDVTFNLRKLVIDNHVNVKWLADDMNENNITDDMLKQAAYMFKKQGWLVCEFNKSPILYHLSVIPQSSKSELDYLIGELGLYVQYF
jgi:hypothetical protein